MSDRPAAAALTAVEKHALQGIQATERELNAKQAQVQLDYRAVAAEIAMARGFAIEDIGRKFQINLSNYSFDVIAVAGEADLSAPPEPETPPRPKCPACPATDVCHADPCEGGATVDLDELVGPHPAIARFGFTCRLNNAFSMVVQRDKLSDGDYQTVIMPRIRLLLGRDPIFGDRWDDGDRFTTWDGKIWK